MVRVNGVDSGQLDADVSALAEVLDRVTAVLLPKADGPEAVATLVGLLERAGGPVGPAVVPIVETPVGVFEARGTAAASPRVATLLFGPVEVAWAEEVVAVAADAEARGVGVARLADGTFIDEPVVRRARSILSADLSAAGVER